ncbi:MAG TPA: CpsD/CapB family tyrosine-protein kinase [Pyrinomonadaceae bacterium]|nr:CpsD/CapB family tyrosine-protein kinase [Pyrinomonadaceae bacterium]
MGRVYEALKRAADTGGANGKSRKANEHEGNGASSNGATHTERETSVASAHSAATPAPPSSAAAASSPVEQLLHSSNYFQAPGGRETPAHTSAPTERTGQPLGSALSDGQASRVAGATLGAAGSARTPEFITLDVSAARVEPHLVAVTQPASPHAERYRSLRTRVLHAGERKKMQAFVITSAGIMEGKTLTSINLCWLLAQTDGVRALLIDGDLRQPCAADYLGLDAPTGLSEILAGEATLDESIIRLEPAGLHLLPGGSPRDNVAELLSGPKFSALLKEVRRMFDYIIIDAPPLGIFTDATVLISRADGALIVARSGKTRYAALDRLLEPLPRERILGVVLNGADERLDEQSYYYKRRYVRRETDAGDAGRRVVREEVTVEEDR